MNSDASGYDIKRTLEQVFSYFYNASYGTIYPTLGKMEKQGLIAKESIIQEGKPNKNVYTITEQGKAAFLSYLQSDIQPVEVKSDFMLRLFFGRYADPKLVIAWLEKNISQTEQNLKQLYSEYEQWKSHMSPTQLICIKIGISHAEGTLKSLQEGLRDIKEETVVHDPNV